MPLAISSSAKKRQQLARSGQDKVVLYVVALGSAGSEVIVYGTR